MKLIEYRVVEILSDGSYFVHDTNSIQHKKMAYAVEDLRNFEFYLKKNKGKKFLKFSEDYRNRYLG